MTDFRVPQRMSLGAFVIYFLKYFRIAFNAIIFFLAYEIFKSDGGFFDHLLKVGIMIAATSALAFVLACISFYQIKFHVENGSLIYRHNLISRASTTIPLDRIHTLRTRQGLLYRILNLRGVLFDTLASKGEEIELILSEADWQCLLDEVEIQEKPQPLALDIPPVYSPTSVIDFSNKDLLLDALCQNHLKGMAVLGGFLVVVFNSLSDLPDSVIDMVAGYLESQLGNFAVSLAGMAIVLVITYLLSLVLWLGRVLLRNFDLSLTYDSKILTFRHGLFSRMSSRFANDKICTVWVKRNFLEKRFGLCSIALRQAFNSTAQKEDDNLKIYTRDCSDFFLGWWLGQDYMSESQIASAKSGNGLFVHTFLPDLIISFVTAAILWHFGLYVWLILPGIYLLAGIPKGILAVRHSYISLRESYLIIGNGRFAEIENYMKYDNVEVVRIMRTPFSRFTGRVSLSLSTSGSSFTIRSLRLDQALAIYDLLLSKQIEASASIANIVNTNA